MAFEIADVRGLGSDLTGQMVVYIETDPNPITEEEWETYTPDPGWIENTPRASQFDVLNVLGSPYLPTGEYTYYTDTHGFTWEAVAAVQNIVWPFDPNDYAGYTPPIVDPFEAGYLLATPLPGTIQYNSNDKNHENIYYATDADGDPKTQYYVTDPWGNVYILKSVNAANDTPDKVAAAVDAAVLPDGFVKSSGYLTSDTTYGPIYSGQTSHVDEFRDSADSAWMQIGWSSSGITLPAMVGNGMPIWGGNSDDLLLGTANDDEMHGAGGNDTIEGQGGNDTIAGDAGDDTIIGGSGTTTAVYWGPSDQYNIQYLPDGSLMVQDTTGADGTDTLTNVQFLEFSDGTITMPPAPSGLALDPASESGVQGDDITNVTQPTITGSGDNGDTVTLLEASTVLGTGIVSDGKWSIASNALPSGQHTLTATQTDVAGHTSIASDALALTIDPAAIPNDFDGDGQSDLLMSDGNNGVLVVGEVSDGPGVNYTAIGDLGPEWRFEGTGSSLLGDGNEGFLLWNSTPGNGTIAVGEDNGGTAQYAAVGGVGPEWSFEGNGPLLGQANDDFLLWDGNGATPEYGSLVVGSVSGGAAQYTQIGGVGSEWRFEGVGGYLGDGNAGFLMWDPTSTSSQFGSVVVGSDVNGAAQYIRVGGLGPEWQFKGTGDLLGHGQDDFLLWDGDSSSAGYGALSVGEVVGGEAQYTQIGAVGPEFQFLGIGDYDGASNSEFLMRDSNTGVLVVATVSNGIAAYTQVGGVGPEWIFHTTSPGTPA